MSEKYKRSIVTFISLERRKQFHMQVTHAGVAHKGGVMNFEFARKLLKMGIEKYNKDKEEAVKSVRGHMDF